MSLHEKLKAQDSEAALVLITKGALGYGSSDIHYDTGEHDVAVRIRIDGELVTITTLER
jgi:type II secretory ATPase GspE/PulE/Tfp pilus assembly ATPase PilB-like protein